MRDADTIKHLIEGVKRVHRHYANEYAWYNKKAAYRYFEMLEARRAVYALEKELKEVTGVCD